MVIGTKKVRRCSIIIPAFLLSGSLAAGQMDSIYRFKGIQIPLSLKIEGVVLDKGMYDMEFLRTPSPVLFYLRIMKKGKILHLVQGEEFPYSGIISDVGRSRDIPDKPTLRLAKDVNQRSLIMVFESGRRTILFPLLRAKFIFSYVDD